MAGWLEGLAGVADLAEVVAHHYAEALALTRATGGTEAELAELRELTGRALVLAGDRAITLDLARAQALYGQAMELFRPTIRNGRSCCCGSPRGLPGGPDGRGPHGLRGRPGRLRRNQ